MTAATLVAQAPAAPPASIVAILTCHNRREQTCASLLALMQAARGIAGELAVVVVDDGSTDGTAEAVRRVCPMAEVLHGDGQLYWCRGMHRGMQHALRMNGISHILWLNDDTQLDPGALAQLLRCEAELRRTTGAPVIVVGATHDGEGRCSYGGGVSAGGWRRLRYARVGGATNPQRCDVFNGNCVLLPIEVVRDVGNLDPVFEHAMGDTDYALRAARRGHISHVAPGFVGSCVNNPTRGTPADPALGLRERWRLLLGRKGLPWRSWLHFTRRHGGVLWPLRFAWPYVKALIGPLRR